MDWLYSLQMGSINTAFIKFYRGASLNKKIKKLSGNYIHAEFLAKKMTTTDIIKTLAGIKDYYLSEDTAIGIIDDRISGKIQQLQKETGMPELVEKNMIKLFILIIICIFAVIRASIAKQAGRPTKFLLISCFVQTIPFGFGKSLYEFIKYSKTEDTEMLGAFGSSISLETSSIFAIALFFMGYTTIRSNSFSLKKTYGLIFSYC